MIDMCWCASFLGSSAIGSQQQDKSRHMAKSFDDFGALPGMRPPKLARQQCGPMLSHARPLLNAQMAMLRSHTAHVCALTRARAIESAKLSLNA